MICRYIAFDGKVFLDSQECLEYEDSLGFVLLDENGNNVASIDDAIAVYLVHNDVSAFRLMLECQTSDTDPVYSEILECGRIGLYLWDDWAERFIYVDPERFHGYMKILEKFSI